MLRLGWAALLCYFPLILSFGPRAAAVSGNGLASLGRRVALFHGVGVLWSVALISAEGLWPRWRALFARPGRGLLLALALYAVAGVAVTAFLNLSAPQPAWALLLLPFDFSALLAGAWPRVSAPWAVERLLIAAGSVAEEWIFRCALWLRWAGALPLDGMPLPLGGTPPPLGDTPQGRPADERRAPGLKALGPHLYKLAGVSLYFTLLHVSQGPPALGQAFGGSIVLGLLLAWRGNFALIATLHVLFNWMAI